MTEDIGVLMRNPVHELVGLDGCLVLSHQDRHEVIAHEALAPKRPSPSPLTL